MNLPAFTVTWDYRCPFARNAHEHVVAALEGGAPLDVTFSPFSLSQAHVAEGASPVWDDPDAAADLFPLRVGVAVRDKHPEQFPAAHRELFAARHDRGADLRSPDVLAEALERAGLDAGPVLAEAAEAWTLEAVRAAHEWSVQSHMVFGVPTFIADGRAAFVRVMTRPGRDHQLAQSTVERILRLVSGHPELNEVKHTTLDR